MMISVVLVEPEIPQNAGNIIRTCAATGCKLYLVKPLGFLLDDKHFKRAGLDYFDLANVEVVDSFEQVYEQNKDKTFYFASTKSKHTYTEVNYPNDCFIVFGKESFGLRESLLKQHYETCIRIPMINDARSLNLSNSVAIIVYEALRQNKFFELKEFGELTGRID
ncbi:MAG: tRNA (cytidine(34)-2'-O)-methyltransferase [Clostridia bacterium]|nr:tRNA (cytidine(34)-2'-O)-methyltransferase [Clostridia bacterium]